VTVAGRGNGEVVGGVRDSTGAQLLVGLEDTERGPYDTGIE